MEDNNGVDPHAVNSFRWHHDGTHIFQIEETLYKLHSDVLSRGSITFRDMFGVRSSDQDELDGFSQSKPITLVQVTVEIFDLFLAIIYIWDWLSAAKQQETSP